MKEWLFLSLLPLESPRQAFLLLSLMDTISQLKHLCLRQYQLASSRPKTSLSFYIFMECKASITFITPLNGVSISVQWALTQAHTSCYQPKEQCLLINRAASSLRQHMEGSLKWATAEVLMSEGHDIGSSGPQRRYLRLLQVLHWDLSSPTVGAGTEGDRESGELPGTRGCRSVLVQAIEGNRR